MLSLEDLFCSVDDFCQKFEPSWQNQLLSNGLSHRNRQRSLCLSAHHEHPDCFPLILKSAISKLTTPKRCIPSGTPPFQVWSVMDGLSSGYLAPCYPCVPTCALVLAGVVASVSSIPPASKSAITAASTNIKCSKPWQHAAKPR